MSNSPLTYKEALIKAMNYCAYQERCHKEVRSKLYEMNLTENERESILVELIEQNYLNEERFAKAFAGGKFRVKKWGINKITQELKQRDISDYCIKKALEEISNDQYVEVLTEILAKQNSKIKESNSYKRKAKIAKYAIGKGYGSQLVWDLIRAADYLE